MTSVGTPAGIQFAVHFRTAQTFLQQQHSVAALDSPRLRARAQPARNLGGQSSQVCSN